MTWSKKLKCVKEGDPDYCLTKGKLYIAWDFKELCGGFYYLIETDQGEIQFIPEDLMSDAD